MQVNVAVAEFDVTELVFSLLRAYTCLPVTEIGEWRMSTKTDFVADVIAIARRIGWRTEMNRDGLAQIDFGNKKLHAGHLEAMFPEILADGVSISNVIEKVAPGRPCTHKPMREIVAELKKRRAHADVNTWRDSRR